MPRFLSSCAFASCLLLYASTAFAQQVNIAGYNVAAYGQEKLGDKHWILKGAVELERADTKIYADEIEFFEDQDRAIARGNVVFGQGNNRIAADSAEFNTKTALGTFHHAQGIASVQPPRQTPQPGGIIVPPISGQETDVIFFGETVEKLGVKKYRITNGGFSTCVQPTPRWDLTADTVVLNIDHYTLLRQSILKVKGVPMLYLPIMYFPTKEDGRATGFLIPTYSQSTIRGQTIHNAFFWAINRSQDATFLYDWFSKTGTGGGGEYRYNMGGGSDGNLTVYRLDERAVTYAQSNGSTVSASASRSYRVDGGANQLLPFNLRARARVNYFSSITANQTSSTNPYSAATNNRSYGANVVGAWRSYSLNGTFDRNEWFNNTTSSGVTGSSPRISLTRSDRPLFTNAPLYFSLGAEAAHLDRLTKSEDVVVDNRSVGRFDFAPQLRYPFKRWQWFTVNTSMSWRETFYTRSLDLTTRLPIDANVNRQYFSVQAQAIGPVFTRVWDTPENGYASRFKHTIEPTFSVQRTSAIDNFNQIILVDGTDSIVGGTTNVAYGLNNRFYAKRKVGQISQAQEIISLEILQTHYTNSLASQDDPRYNSAYSSTTANNFSPVSVNLRVAPTTNLNGSARLEVDSHYHKPRNLSVNASYNLAQHLQTSVGWSHKFFIKGLPFFDDPALLDHYINVASNVHTRDNKYGVNYSFNYDVLRSTMLQQRISAFYNAQCCGIAVEYQRYNLSGVPTSLVPSDHRFFLSFTLAGLGNFSPFNGGLNGVPR